MSKAAEKITWAQLLAWIVRTATTLWSAIKNVWDVIQSFWDVISPVWNEVQNLWTWTKNFAGQIWSDWIQPIGDGLSWATGSLSDAFKWIDDQFKNVTGWIEGIKLGPLEDIKNLLISADTLAEKVGRLTSYIDKDLGIDIATSVQKVYDQTLGQIEKVRSDLLGKINEIKDLVDKYTIDVYYSILDVINPYIEKIELTASYILPSFDKPQLLSKNTVKQSTTMYGDTMYFELFKKTHEPLPPNFIDIINEKIPHSWLDDHIKNMVDFVEGGWSDVAHIIVENHKAMVASQTPVGGDLDDSLLSEDEQSEIEQTNKKLAEYGL